MKWNEKKYKMRNKIGYKYTEKYNVQSLKKDKWMKIQGQVQFWQWKKIIKNAETKQFFLFIIKNRIYHDVM